MIVSKKINKGAVMARILLVEDNIINQKLAESMLENIGYKPDIAANGKEALGLLRDQHYDLILMDIQMPEMDGYETTKIIRDPSSKVVDHEVTIIAMTASVIESEQDKCIAAGMNGFIAKPINPNELREAVSRCLSGQAGGPDGFDVEMAKKSEPPPLGDDESKVLMLAKMLERIGGSLELANRLLALYVRETPAFVVKMRQALKEGNAPDVQLNAHSIKGASANIGGELVREKALAIEMAAKEKDLARAEGLMTGFDAEFDRLCQTIRARLG